MMKKAKFSSNFKQNGANLMSDPICTAFPFINDNHFIFFEDALIGSMKTMEGRPMNFMHDQTNIVGHVTKVWSDMKDVKMNQIPRTCKVLSSQMVFYDHIFPEMFQKITNGQADDRFKTSVEVQFKDLKWALFDKNNPESTLELIAEGKSEDLDFLGFMALIFGTANGITYNGKEFGIAMAPDSKELNFVGLAITDELNGAAADQNTDLTVLGTFSSVKSAFMASGTVDCVKMNKAMSDIVAGATIGEIELNYGVSRQVVSDLVSKAKSLANARKKSMKELSESICGKDPMFSVENGKVTCSDLYMKVKAMHADQLSFESDSTAALLAEDEIDQSIVTKVVIGVDTEVVIGVDTEAVDPGFIKEWSVDAIGVKLLQHNADEIERAERVEKQINFISEKIGEILEKISSKESGEEKSTEITKLLQEIELTGKTVDNLNAKLIENEKRLNEIFSANSAMEADLGKKKESIDELNKIILEKDKKIETLLSAAGEQGIELLEVKNEMSLMREEIGKLRNLELFELGLSSVASAIGESIKTMSSDEFENKKKELSGISTQKSSDVLVGSESAEDKRAFFARLANKNKE